MLKLYPEPKAGEDRSHAVWFDLLEPSPEELKEVEAAVGARLPTHESLSEIEMSSRLRAEGGLLYMSTPSASRRGTSDLAVAPVGFVLSKDQLVTLRFTALASFDAVADRLASEVGARLEGPAVFATLCEEIVGAIADRLENLALELGGLSVTAFHTENAKGRHAVRSNRVLRIQLRQLGRLGDRLSDVRDVLQGLGRVVAFADQNTKDRCDAALQNRFASLRQDIVSLGEYEEQLANKVQFVLDAMVGLIGIAQNDIFKVLTIVSIAGIPPTLVAGIYGMNFKNMPEYNWAFGYEWGLALILITTIVPLVWFKLKGWF